MLDREPDLGMGGIDDPGTGRNDGERELQARSGAPVSIIEAGCRPFAVQRKQSSETASASDPRAHDIRAPTRGRG